MKIRIISLLVIALTVTGSVFAQQRKGTRRNRVKANRGLMMARHLMLDDRTAAEFTPIYNAYVKEIRECKKSFRGNKMKASNLSDSQIIERMENRFKCAEKTLKIRKSYYSKFSKILTPRQVQKVFMKQRKFQNRGQRRMIRKMRTHNKSAKAIRAKRLTKAKEIKK